MKFLSTFLILIFLQSSQADEVLNLQAIYKIPASQESDASYSQFTLENYQVRTVGKEAFLSYTLPEEMTGIKQKIEMKLVLQNSATKVLEGEKAIALCVGKWLVLKCDVKFKKISIDLFKVKEKLETTGASVQEINGRLSVLSKFSGDPIGESIVVGEN